MTDDNKNYSTSNFRQSIIQKIRNEATLDTGTDSHQHFLKMEANAFHMANNKDEYLKFVDRLILRIREMDSKNQNISDDETIWRSPNFRRIVAQKINEAIMSISPPRNGIEMEELIFQKAKNKGEYLGFVARLILHVREMNSKSENTENIGDVNKTCVPDAIKALQNLDLGP